MARADAEAGTQAGRPKGLGADAPQTNAPSARAPHDSAAGAGAEAGGSSLPSARPPLLAALLTRAFLLALAWWALSEGQQAALWIGALALPAALLFSLHLLPATAHTVRPWQVLRFGLWFLYASLLAGIDVARQVLHPRLPIGPALVHLDTRLPPGAPRLLLAGVIGLLPGSVCVSLSGDSLLLHQLNTQQDAETQLRDVERRIASLLGLTLEAGHAN